MVSRTHPAEPASLLVPCSVRLEGGAVIRTVGIMPGRPFQRRRTEEPTGERTTGTGGEHEAVTAGGFRRYREEDGSEDPIPLRYRSLDKDCWARGALA
ncbi:hypothetical protein NDU88_001790 [Pleurodeles waltl]|uniref:Uncharacterized protein n=1 Tax=Pleurodeles waltl TaxID=8319 RepID=A0AAV7LDV3_PLEWA|nr:hypothetical protein NDU88_001790 [Pleurodeles waltl]